ncbi:MAG: IS30 family transposase [Casimicrobium sp.]|jgi:IS30 family transposase
MAKKKHGRCQRNVRSAVGSVGRPGVGLRDERARFWKAIRSGLSSEKAGTEAGVSPAVGARWFRQSGGMPNLSLDPTSDRFLSFDEREHIALLRAQGHGVREIARQVARAASTISRELRRNAATRSGYVEYRAMTAHWHAQRRASRPKQSKLASNASLKKYVQDRLSGVIEIEQGKPLGPQPARTSRRHGPRQDRSWATAWSPEQIAHRLPIDFPDDVSMRISHEAIYQALFVGQRGALSPELSRYLRTGRRLRVPRARTRGRTKGFITPELMITQRPAHVDTRVEPGHWEGDLIIGLNSSAVGTLVERTTRYTRLLHLPPMHGHGGARKKNGPALAGHGAHAVCTAICASLLPLAAAMRRTLTWDQGAEMSQHIELRKAAGINVYFCDPHSPWQRGTNENTNGLLRQYFPKGTDLSRYSAIELNAVAAALNNRPRKVLDWRTPFEAMRDHLASIN